MNLALVQPWCSIGSDGTALAIEGPLRSGHPHPRSFGTFARVLGEYVRHRRLLRLEDAVRKMTSLNAAKTGIVDRGVLRPGLFADVTIFDPQTVTDHATYTPAARCAMAAEVQPHGWYWHPGRLSRSSARRDACTHDREKIITGQRAGSERRPLPSSSKTRSTGRLEARLQAAIASG
jgi:hypothetical protein